MSILEYRRRRLVPTLATPLLVLALTGLTGCSGDPAPTPAPTSAPASAPAATPSSTAATPAGESPSAAAPDASSAAPSDEAEPAPTTEAPAPGSTASTVPPRAQPTNKPAKKLLKTKSTVAPELTVELTSVRSQRVKATLPGEISGDAVVLRLRIDNGTSRAVDLGNVVVTVLGSDDAPATEITGDPAAPVTGSLRPGARTSGTYVFVLDKDLRDPITVNATVSADTTVAVFKGPVR